MTVVCKSHVKNWIPIRRIPEMNIPVPPFAKGGLGGIFFLPPLQFGLSIPPAPLLQRGVNFLGNRLTCPL